MTAAHLWGECPSDIDGSTASHNNEEIGEIEEFDANLDYALLSETGSQSWESGVDCEKTPSEIPSSISLNGIVSKMGLKTEICMPNCSNRDPIYKMGVVSGVTKGGLQMIDASAGPNCVDYGNNGIRVDAYNVEGDSGGPFFYEDGGDYYLAGIQQTYIDNYPFDSGCNGGENAPTGEGVAAFHLKNELNIEPA